MLQSSSNVAFSRADPRSHLWWPLLFGGLALLSIAFFDVDRRFAEAWFFNPQAQAWIGRHEFWANEFLHTGGRNLMRLTGVIAIIGWAASFRIARLQPHRRALGYFALCMALVPLTVGALKEATNVDCPWDLQGFGGDRPLVHWYQDRPDDLPRAACFPGAHSSSAFALFALYFLWLPGNPRRARWALLGVLVLGAAFSIAQQSRGAHFISHDLASALIAWLICFGLHWRFHQPQLGKHDASVV